jgi:PKHD-type hydroxylase
MLIVIENVLTQDEVAAFREALGGARWLDGAGSAGTRSIAVKQNEQADRADPVVADLAGGLLARLGRTPLFVSASLAEKIWPPVFNCYQEGGHYGVHSDSALMHLPEQNLTLRSDLAATLFLSDPADYDGGELVIEEAFGAQAVKLAAGDMVLYPASSLHQVTPVTRGRRICAITWLQSAVPDGAARELLFDLDQAIQALSPECPPDDARIGRLVHVYHNLVRRWARV